MPSTLLSDDLRCCTCTLGNKAIKPVRCFRFFVQEVWALQPHVSRPAPHLCPWPCPRARLPVSTQGTAGAGTLENPWRRSLFIQSPRGPLLRGWDGRVEEQQRRPWCLGGRDGSPGAGAGWPCPLPASRVSLGISPRVFLRHVGALRLHRPGPGGGSEENGSGRGSLASRTARTSGSRSLLLMPPLLADPRVASRCPSGPESVPVTCTPQSAPVAQGRTQAPPRVPSPPSSQPHLGCSSCGQNSGPHAVGCSGHTASERPGCSAVLLPGLAGPRTRGNTDMASFKYLPPFQALPWDRPPLQPSSSFNKNPFNCPFQEFMAFPFSVFMPLHSGTLWQRKDVRVLHW